MISKEEKRNETNKFTYIAVMRDLTVKVKCHGN